MCKCNIRKKLHSLEHYLNYLLFSVEQSVSSLCWQHDMKLLAVDIPMASGPDHRLFMIGDEEEYKVGGGLISQLIYPVLKAMTATKEFGDLDQCEEAEREQQEAEKTP